MHVCMCMHVCTCTVYVCTSTVYACICMHVHVCVCMYACTCICIYLYLCMYILCTHKYMHVHIDIHFSPSHLPSWLTDLLFLCHPSLEDNVLSFSVPQITRFFIFSSRSTFRINPGDIWEHLLSFFFFLRKLTGIASLFSQHQWSFDMRVLVVALFCSHSLSRHAFRRTFVES